MAHTKTTRSIFSLIAALMAVFLMAAPALAHHKAGHGQGASTASEDKGSQSKSAKDTDGDADSDPNTAYTEDNDTNDGGTKNNVSDEGDNAHPSGKDRSVENGKSGNQGKSESDPDDNGRGPDRSNGGPDKPNGSGGVDKADQDGNNGCGNDDDFEDDNEGWCGGKPKGPKTKGPKTKGPKTPPTSPPPGGTCPSGTHMEGGKCVKNNSGGNDKITICHATGSSTNPYVVITISVNGLNGHGDHEGDIIPMPAGGCPAVQGEVITNNPCPFDVTMPATSPNCGPTAPPVDTDDSDPEPIVLAETIDGDEDNATPPVAAERNPQTVAVLGAVLPFTGASLLGFVAAAFGLIAAGFAALKLRRN